MPDTPMADTPMADTPVTEVRGADGESILYDGTTVAKYRHHGTGRGRPQSCLDLP